MSHDFLQELERRVLIGDGAMGTMLFDRGVEQSACCDEVSLTSPELVKDIHTAYLRAGADVIETNTFSANAIRLAVHNLYDRTKAINLAAARVAKNSADAAGRQVFIAGAIGPTGEAWISRDSTSGTRIYDAYRPQIEGLLEGGVDLLVLETFSDFHEIEFVVDTIRRHSDLPIVAQMSFGENMRIASGATPEECAAFLDSLPVQVIGANCSVGPETMVPVIRRIAASTSKPLSAMPNAGLPRIVGGRLAYDVSPYTFAVQVSSMILLGARLIGGCCGTTPEYIRRLAELVNAS